MKDLLKSKLIIEDGEYYYLFRSLNAGDRDDLARNITTVLDEDGNPVVDEQGRTVISRIRTDRQRVEDKKSELKEMPRYELEDVESLEEVFDHIKMHQRKDTNCISLSANANVTFTYYANESPQYVVVKVRKDDESVFNAAEYMLESIGDRFEEAVKRINNPFVLGILQRIKEAKSTDEIRESAKRSYLKRIGTYFVNNNICRTNILIGGMIG